jgi:hypothetical protein
MIDEGESTDEVTAVVAAAEEVDEETTQPGVRAPEAGPIRMPRFGITEVDQALADLERALGQLTTQEVRLMVVAGAAFVSLFLPWVSVVEHGARMPATARLGLDLTPASVLVSMALIGAILARPKLDQMVPMAGVWLVRAGTVLLILLFAGGMTRAPSDVFPSAYSLFVFVPFLVTSGLALGVLERLPCLPRWRR